MYRLNLYSHILHFKALTVNNRLALLSSLTDPLYTMNVSKAKNANVQLLHCLVDDADTVDSDYRFLVDGKYVKYVTTAPETFQQFVSEDCFERLFGPVLLGELLPPFPVGSWNKGHVAKDPKTGDIAFITAEVVALPGVENLWHPVKLNELDFTQKESVRQRVRISTHPELNDGKPVLIKTAVWPWEIPAMENETAIYERIGDKGIGPKFLGHVTEGSEGRVVGFVVECVQDARTAGPGDLESCKRALEQLHELGIKHGDINKHNFLVQEGDNVIMIDFETSTQCSSQELKDEMKTLKESLEDLSFRGGREVIGSE
ncbi:hypothetical protein H0H93_014290 [Arthromyces matolae]|nr:hypothetical protein H0H93_014290 [Arthromyces matolae]